MAIHPITLYQLGLKSFMDCKAIYELKRDKVTHVSHVHAA